MAEKHEKSEIALNLIKHRKSNGFTQENIAQHLKIKRSTYAYYERNVYPPQDVIKKLSMLYNIGVHELLYGKPDPIEINRLKIEPIEGSVLTFRDQPNFFSNDHMDNETLSTLTVKERRLVALFRLLPAQYRERILKEVEELSEKLD